MVLKALVDSVDELPEPIREHYKPHDGGGFILDTEAVGDFALENVGGLNKALATERQRAKDYEKRLKAFGEVDPERLRKDLSELEKLRAADPEGKLKVRAKEIEDSLTARFTGEIQEREQRIAALTQELDTRLLEGEAMRFLSLKGEDTHGSPDLVLPVIRQRARVVEDGDRRVVEFLDDHGQPLYSKKTGAMGSRMGMQEFLLTLRGDQRYAAAFYQKAGSGGGLDGVRNGSRAGNFSGLSGAQKMAAARKAGLAPTR